jgi:hypothetical protein
MAANSVNEWQFDLVDRAMKAYHLKPQKIWGTEESVHSSLCVFVWELSDHLGHTPNAHRAIHALTWYLVAAAQEGFEKQPPTVSLRKDLFSEYLTFARLGACRSKLGKYFLGYAYRLAQLIATGEIAEMAFTLNDIESIPNCAHESFVATYLPDDARHIGQRFNEAYAALKISLKRRAV